MKRILSIVSALIMMLGTLSALTFTANAEGREALTWPKSDYDFKNEAVTPSPFLGELKSGENTASSLLKGYYTFTAPESGYYSIDTWFRISDKIENNAVTELSYYGAAGPLGGIIKLEKNSERCLQFYDNLGVEEEKSLSDSYKVTIDFLGSTVSALPQADTLCSSCFKKVEDGYYQIDNFPVVFRFSNGVSTTDSSFFGTIDNTDIGKHKVSIEMPIDDLENLNVDINITDHPDADNDGKCDICTGKMTGGKHCRYCGKIHTGSIKEWFTALLHWIIVIVTPAPPVFPF